MMKEDGRLYHVTSLTRLESLRVHGLSGGFTRVRPGHVHLAIDEAVASIYHGHWDEGPCLLISVPIGDLDVSMLGPDREDLMDILDQEGEGREWDDLEWEESLALSGNCTYEGVIPPASLHVEAYRDEVHGNDIEVGLPLRGWSGPGIETGHGL